MAQEHDTSTKSELETTQNVTASPEGITVTKTTHKPKAPKPRLASAPAPVHKSKATKDIDGAETEEAPKDPDKKQAAQGAKFLALVVAAYVAFLFFSGQIGQFVEALKNVELNWIFGGLICMCVYFALGTLAYATAVYLDPESPVGFRDLMAVEASGNFFGNLTPMMAGALPSQIYQLTKSGLSVGEASAVQFTRFIMFQLGVVVVAAGLLIAKLEFFFESYGDIVILNVLVFAGHAIELIALFVICLCPNFVRRAGNSLLHWASRHGWVKNREKWEDMINVQVSQFSTAFRRSAKNIPDMIFTFVVTCVMLCFMYSVPWFVLHAFGIEADFVTCLAAGSMVQLVSSAVPLPGGTGGAEGGFALFFGPMLGSYATAGFLVWRVITFFFPTFAAVPMLGLKSAHKESIYHRVHRWFHLDDKKGPAKKASAASSGSSTHGAPKAVQTSSGITVKPRANASGVTFKVKESPRKK